MSDPFEVQGIFPRHKCGLYLTHNEHRDIYEPVEKWIAHRDFDGDWVSEEQKAKALSEDSLWVLQWYPDTPIGFYRVAGADLNEVLMRAMEIEHEYLKERE